MSDWSDPSASILADVKALADDYRSRMGQSAAVLTLFLPAWSEPTEMTDDQFRATAGAAFARMQGFSAVQWSSGWDEQPTRTIEL